MNNAMMNITPMAVLFAVAAALSFALWNIYMQRALERGASSRMAILTVAVCVTVLFLPVTLVQGWNGSLPALDPGGLAAFFGASLMAAAVAPFHTTQATRRIGAAQTTALRLLDPFFAFGIGLLFLGEQVVGNAIGGVLLIVSALGLLQLDGRRAGTGQARQGRSAGILFAVGASLFFTLGSVLRKVGLTAIPSAFVSAASEGLTGLLIMIPLILLSGRKSELRTIFDPRHRDLWYSGLGSAAGSLFLNLALQRLPVPVAVALRNTSPWFALVLVPVILGTGHRPGRWTWAGTLLLTAGMLLILSR